jgi:L-glyceraldehyde 3-phosphate reductase
LGLDYVDIFYHHRPDPDTPLEETMGALDHLVRAGKALHVGVSNYPAPVAKRAAELLRSLGTPCLIHQPAYNLFHRGIEAELLATLEQQGVGCIAFSPLAQGLLTSKYLAGIPVDSRAGKPTGFLRPEQVTEDKLSKVRALDALAKARGQTLPQLALAWVLRHPQMTSALIGASRIEQLDDAVRALDNLALEAGELARIDQILAG